MLHEGSNWEDKTEKYESNLKMNSANLKNDRRNFIIQ